MAATPTAVLRCRRIGLGFIMGAPPSPCMDVNPDIVAAVAMEAWLMARTEALRTGPPLMTQDAATRQAIEELKDRYPALGGALRRLTVANTFGTRRAEPERSRAAPS